MIYSTERVIRCSWVQDSRPKKGGGGWCVWWVGDAAVKYGKLSPRELFSWQRAGGQFGRAENDLCGEHSGNEFEGNEQE